MSKRKTIHVKQNKFNFGTKITIIRVHLGYNFKYIYLLQSRYYDNVQFFKNYDKHNFLSCKYFATISVASSVEVTLQFYFEIFYSTAPNKIIIKLRKLKRTNC